MRIPKHEIRKGAVYYRGRVLNVGTLKLNIPPIPVYINGVCLRRGQTADMISDELKYTIAGILDHAQRQAKDGDEMANKFLADIGI